MRYFRTFKGKCLRFPLGGTQDCIESLLTPIVSVFRQPLQNPGIAQQVLQRIFNVGLQA